MRGNGKVFISHTHADNALCQPLLAALDAWGVDYWFDTQQLEPGQHLSERLQQAIRDRDIFIRICTAHTTDSYWMTLELSAFRSLQLADQRVGASGGRPHKAPRVTVNLMLDPHFDPGPADNADYVIEAYRQPQAQTLAQLRTILDLPRARGASGISRRTAIGLGAAGVVTLGALGGAGALLVDKGRSATPPPYPKPRVIAFTNPQTLDPRIRWYFKAGDGDDAPNVTLAGGVLFVASMDGLYALKAEDGSLLWANPGATASIDEVPVVVGNILYINAGLENLYALNTSDGSQVWVSPAGNLLSGRQFTVAGGVLYALTADGTIQAYNAATGAKLWSGGSAGKPANINLGPTVANSIIYTGGEKGLFSALSATDGTTLWTFQTGDEIDARPVVAGGLVYFGSNDQTLYALDATTGALVWRYNSDAQVSVAPVIVGSTAYIGINTTIYAFDAGSGKLLWKAPAGIVDSSGNVENSFDQMYGQPAIAGNTLYFVRSENTYAMDLAKHTILWRFASGASGFGGLGSSATPIIGDGVVYFACDNHTLYALSAS